MPTCWVFPYLVKTVYTMERFQFRRHLYLISNHISSSEVENLKFLVTDFLPRRKVEKVKTAFELFCLLEGIGNISATETAFLGELLQSLRKKHLIQQLEQGRGSGVGARAPHVATPPEAALMGYDVQGLVKKFKELLLEISDNLEEAHVRDVALFFFDPGVPGLTLMDIEEMRSGSTLFQVLRDNRTITPTNLERLQIVLETIGRRDLCSMINDYMTSNNDFVTAPHWGRDDGGGRGPSGVQPSDDNGGGGVYPTDYLSMHSQGSGHYTTQSSVSSAPYTRSFQSGNYDSARQPSSQPRLADAPITQSSGGDPGNCPVVYGNATRFQRRLTTAQLSLAVDEKDGIIRKHEEKIQALEKALEKLTAGRQQDRESQLNEVEGLRDQLGRKIMEHRSLQEEIQCLRGQLLRAEDVPLYEMTCKPHGVAVIIVNEAFMPNPMYPSFALERREGAWKDFKLFQQTFKHLDYVVESHKDLTSVDMYRVLDDVAKRNHSKYDSFVCCISTHGDEHVMYGTDGVGVKRAEFDQPLKSCQTLMGKPKMFFIQACRGTPVEQVKPDCPTGLTFRPPRIPLDRDVFQANATTSRNASYRSPRDGSWFVNALHQVFTMQADFRTLVPMMCEVNKLVSSSYGVVSHSDEEVVQCAEWTTTFTKGVRFRQAITPEQIQQLP